MDASIARRGQFGCEMRKRRVDTNEWSEAEGREGRKEEREGRKRGKVYESHG